MSAKQLERSKYDRYVRLLSIIDRLSEGRYYSSSELAEFLSVSRRTIFRDLRKLKEVRDDLHYDPACEGFILKHQNTPVRNSVGACELSVLKVVSELLYDEPLKVQEDFSENVVVNIDMPKLSGIFTLIQESMSISEKVRIRFVEEVDGSKSTLFSPFLLVINSDDWCVIGRSSYHKSNLELKGQQIKSVEKTELKFETPSRFARNYRRKIKSLSSLAGGEQN